MKPEKAEVGRVVVSLQGHDQGTYYCVVAVGENRMLSCCDGRLRRLNEPKKKREKHLRALPFTIDLKAKGASGGLFDDSDLRKALEQVRLQYSKESTQFGGKLQDQQKEECALVQK